MNRILVVCLALTLTTSLGVFAGQSVRDAEIPRQAAPPMQKGVTVEMPATSSAAPMPDADQNNARIVTVTRDGELYLGASPIKWEALSSQLRDRASANGPGNTLFIKADARVPYLAVIKVLDAATRAGYEKTVLLTSQNDSPQPGAVSPPKGFTIPAGECLRAYRPRLSL
jgi:biopolymer transport protein ExbD